MGLWKKAAAHVLDPSSSYSSMRQFRRLLLSVATLLFTSFLLLLLLNALSSSSTPFSFSSPSALLSWFSSFSSSSSSFSSLSPPPHPNDPAPDSSSAAEAAFRDPGSHDSGNSTLGPASGNSSTIATGGRHPEEDYSAKTHSVETAAPPPPPPLPPVRTSDQVTQEANSSSGGNINTTSSPNTDDRLLNASNSSSGGGSGGSDDLIVTEGRPSGNNNNSSSAGGIQGGGGGGILEKVDTAVVPAKDIVAGASNSSRSAGGLSAGCNIFDGRWVKDEQMPYYPPASCPHIDEDFNCHQNGRPDGDYFKWRWQPYSCDIPRLNATDFLSRLKGKRLLFVGDSLNRNMWESLVCILRHSVRDKKRVYEASGKTHFKTKGYYSFIFKDYKCSIDYVRSPFLVRELYYKNRNGSEDERLRLDLLDETTIAYHQADIIVFNTGHWWTHEKTSKGIYYYQEGDHLYPLLKVLEAYRKALTTWSRWVDRNIDPGKTQVVFRGYSLTHFRGGQWNSGGQCHKETEPIFNQSYLAHYPSKMKVLESVLGKMKTPVVYLNISRLTDYRKDGHPSIYRKKYKSAEEQIAAEKSQDCSHWCLPGVPDSWNELLYASLLMIGKGSWKR